MDHKRKQKDNNKYPDFKAAGPEDYVEFRRKIPV